MIGRALILSLLLVGILAAPVSAHATVISCDPAIGANLPEPPARLVCSFSELLKPDGNSLEVFDPQGQKVDRGDTKLSGADAMTMSVTLDTGKMGTGIYTVRWSVTSVNDNAVTRDQFQFGVRTVVPPTATPVLPGVPMSPQASPDPGLVPRFFIGAGIAVLGATVFILWKMRRDSRSEQVDDQVLGS